MPSQLITIFCTLFTAGMMWPSEGAINGSGLHLSLLWLAAGVVTIWSLRTSVTVKSVFDAMTLGWIVLLLGFWVSAYSVFQIDGDRRAALNLCFEWTAIVVAYRIVWCMAVISKAKQQMMAVVIGLCFGAAVLGIVQHHVTYAAQAEWYRNGRAVLDAAAETASLENSTAARQVAAEFEAMDIPLAGGARELFEGRLLSSSEPVGPFALANTLAGFLAMALVLIVGTGLEYVKDSRGVAFRFCLRCLPFAITIAYCLVLTKSRTAWVAGAVGVAVLLFTRGHSAKLISRSAIWGTLLSACVVGAGIGTGAIDKEVVLESPRSLQFRLLYWIGAAGVIQEKPLFGAGPGNFRQTYLAHKPVESSEEILDPHNVILDAWCSAGVLGLLGIFILGWQCFHGVFSGNSESGCGGQPAKTKPAILGVFAGTILHLAWRWINGGPFWVASADSFISSQNLVLLVPVGAAIATVIAFSRISPSRPVLAAAAMTLFVHLMGAGGLQITAIGLILGLLTGCMRATEKPAEQYPSESRFAAIYKLAATGVLLFGVVLIVNFGLIPIRRAEQYLAHSRLLEQRGNLSGAVAQLQLGLDSDVLSPKLRQRHVEKLAYQMAALSSAPAHLGSNAELPISRLLDKTLLAAQELISADRRNWSAYVARSNVRRLAAEAGLGDENLEMAIDDLKQATTLYSTNAELWVMLAELSDTAGNCQLTIDAVERALAIEASNREWGHVDRFLSKEKSLWLETKRQM